MTELDIQPDSTRQTLCTFKSMVEVKRHRISIFHKIVLIKSWLTRRGSCQLRPLTVIIQNLGKPSESIIPVIEHRPP